MKAHILLPLVAVACAVSACGTPTDDVAQTPATTVIRVTEYVQETPMSEPAKTAETAQEATQAKLQSGPCDIASIRTDLGVQELDNVSYCDGMWAMVGKTRTDWIVRVLWDGSRWAKVPFDGETKHGMTQGCYLPGTLARLNPPDELTMPKCDPNNY
ncbi:hypothetical protein CKALI_11855 [Corynebacterium kalinowskii]|uniref:Secreted protein n=1 Tax=Corynebacterium kalinowskii TaxID=2675216 RepID=A0A6B8VJI6_9CORY|nr:hypothetical protein [Corynebacterium kalinowskii]QGU03209.1 hypothetical protein CKALI_11855 [Corynebacterium kalinowskii]